MDSYDPQRQPEQDGSSVILKNLALILTGSMLLAASVSLFGIWRAGDRFFQNLQAVFTAPQPAPQVDVKTVIVEQVQGASELTTAVFAMEAVVPASRDRTLAGYVVGKTTLLYIGYGEVRAGVDLSQITAEDIQVDGEFVSLRLPPPQVLDSKIDVNRSSVYDYDRGFLSLGPDVAPQLHELAQRETLQKIVETACTEGLLQEANQRAESVVGQLLNTAGYSEIVVETQPPASNTCTPSSQ